MSNEPLTLFDTVYECVAIQADETIRCWERTSSSEVVALVQMLSGAKSIVFAGAGRTKHLLAASASRFEDLGASVTLAEEVIPSTVQPGATILVACPSGNTAWITSLGEAARAAGARVAAFTGRRESAIAAIADAILWIDAFSPGNGKPPASQQRPGVLFDQAVFMILEAITETLEQRPITLPSDRR